MSEKKVIRKKKKLGSYPHVTVVFSISLALFVLGLFGLLLIHANKISNNLKNSFEVHIYLNNNLSEAQINELKHLLETKKFVASSNGKKDIVFVSKEEAAESFISQNNEDFQEVLGYNPLKNAFKIKVEPKFTGEASISDLKLHIEELNGVFEVDMVESLIHEINRRVSQVGIFLLGFAVVLIIVIFILINNTIKLALFSQRFLIRSMQLVGATASFIQLPYMKRAALQGLLAGALSGLSLFGILQYAYSKFEELKILEDLQQFFILFAVLLTFGVLIGLFSSMFAVRRYTKMSLDDLY